MKDKIVVALGGNALGNTPEEQIQAVRHTAKPIVDLIADGHEVIIAHGNGPQVGMINLAMDVASKIICGYSRNAISRVWSYEPRLYRLPSSKCD